MKVIYSINLVVSSLSWFYRRKIFCCMQVEIFSLILAVLFCLKDRVLKNSLVKRRCKNKESKWKRQKMTGNFWFKVIHTFSKGESGGGTRFALRRTHGCVYWIGGEWSLQSCLNIDKFRNFQLKIASTYFFSLWVYNV